MKRAETTYPRPLSKGEVAAAGQCLPNGLNLVGITVLSMPSQRIASYLPVVYKWCASRPLLRGAWGMKRTETTYPRPLSKGEVAAAGQCLPNGLNLVGITVRSMPTLRIAPCLTVEYKWCVSRPLLRGVRGMKRSNNTYPQPLSKGEVAVAGQCLPTGLNLVGITVRSMPSQRIAPYLTVEYKWCVSRPLLRGVKGMKKNKQHTKTFTHYEEPLSPSAAIATLMASGCHKEQELVTLGAIINQPSKTYIDNRHLCWNEGDQVFVNTAAYPVSAISGSSAQIAAVAGSDSYRALFPASLVTSGSDIATGATVPITLPATQN